MSCDEQNKIIKVLQYTYGGKSIGGIETFLCNVYRHINNQQIQFDFYLQNGNSLKLLEKDIYAIGGKIIYGEFIDNYFYKLVYHTKMLVKVLRENKYNIIHINMESPLWIFHAGFIAKLCGVRNVIIHAHSTQRKNENKYRFISFLLNKAIQNIGDYYFCASEEAGKFLFSKRNDVVIIKNGIDIDEFLFDNDIREKYREMLGVKNCYVIGHIGRFEENKNQKFVIKLLVELKKYEKDIKLILVGGYEEETYFEQVKGMISENNLESDVIILENRSDINHILQAFDILLFPSFKEGFGIVAVEGQAAGLHVLASDSLPKATNVSDLIEYLSVNYNDDLWIKKIRKYKSYKRLNMKEIEALKEYDIKYTVRVLESYYKKACNKWT